MRKTTPSHFFFALAKMLKENGGEWEGEIATLPELLHLPPLTPRAIYFRLLRRSAGTRVQVLELDRTRARLRLTDREWCDRIRADSYPTNAFFFFELAKFVKKNGGVWEGEIDKLPELLHLPITPRIVYWRILQHAKDYRFRVLELNRTRVKLKTKKKRCWRKKSCLS